MSIIITHDKHGEAHCDEHQLAEFIALGWKKKEKAKPVKNDKDGDGKPDPK